MKWLNSWASTVVASVIIATLIEMILPEGKNKKYIKTVIGIFVLFSIIAPVISQFTGGNIDFNSILSSNISYDYKEYDKSIDTDRSILETYKNKLKEEMISKIEDKGYKVNDIQLEIDNSEKKYGNINKIELQVTKNEKIKNIDAVNKIEINIKNKTEEENTAKKDTEELKEYLADAYQINKDNIIIN